MYDVFRFWLDLGVDGFRLDVFNCYYKDAKYRDNPAKLGIRAFDRQEHIYDTDQPELLGALQNIRKIVDENPDGFTVGETFLSTPKKAAQYCQPGNLHMTFNFDFNTVPGEYHIIVYESLNSPVSIGNGTISIIQTSESTFYFSVDNLTNDTIPDFTFNIVGPYDILPSTPKRYSANIDFIGNSMYRLARVDEPMNYFQYFDYTINGINARFVLSLRSNHSPYDTLQYSIRIEGER